MTTVDMITLHTVLHTNMVNRNVNLNTQCGATSNNKSFKHKKVGQIKVKHYIPVSVCDVQQ